jgi:hypothetical protein
VDVLMLSAASGRGRTLLTDSDSAAYVDVDDYPIWVNGGRQFLWLSDASGWRQLYLHNRDGSLVGQVTRDGADVLGVVAVDEKRDRVYVQAAAPTPTQRQIFRYPLRGGRAERVTTAPGTHAATVAPGARYLVDSYSTASQPPTLTLYELPKMRRVRVLQGNEAVKADLPSWITLLNPMTTITLALQRSLYGIVEFTNDAGHVEQILDQAFLRLRIAVDGLERAVTLVLADQAVDQHTGPAGNCRQRRSQFVRDGHDELILQRACSFGFAARCLFAFEQQAQLFVGVAKPLGLRLAGALQLVFGTALGVHQP